MFSHGMGCPSMQRVPKPGASSRAFNNFCMLASPGASSLTHKHKHKHTAWDSLVQLRTVGDSSASETVWDICVPDEGDLVLVHPGLQLQSRIFSKWGYDETEDQSDADEHSRKNNLQNTKSQIRGQLQKMHGHVKEKVYIWYHVINIKLKRCERTWAKKPFLERRAYRNRFHMRATNCCLFRLQPFTWYDPLPSVQFNQSVSRHSEVTWCNTVTWHRSHDTPSELYWYELAPS